MHAVSTFDSPTREQQVTGELRPEVLSQPVELDISLLSHVAGGSPNGTWRAASTAGGTPTASPNGTW